MVKVIDGECHADQITLPQAGRENSGGTFYFRPSRKIKEILHLSAPKKACVSATDGRARSSIKVSSSLEEKVNERH
jgi:hypothetical protein